MMKTNNIYFRFFFAGIALLSFTSVRGQANEILSAIEREVERNKTELKIGDLQAPFFISYALVDFTYMDIRASNGALLRSHYQTNRRGYPRLLVGNYDKNNANFMNFNTFYGRGNYPQPAPLENDPGGIATSIWRDLDNQYKSAAEVYEAKLAVIRQQNVEEDELNLPDFEQREPVSLILEPVNMFMEKEYWENYVRKASEILSDYPEIINSQVSAYFRNAMAYYYNTEKAQYAIPSPYYRLQLYVSTTTADGQDIYDDLLFEYPSFEDLPDLETFRDTCHIFLESFRKLVQAPLIDEAYSGPVLFEKQALAEAIKTKFFTQALIAKRKPASDNETKSTLGSNPQLQSNSLEMMLDKKLISRSLSITSLSGSQEYNGRKLYGYFPLDAEGVTPDKELNLVENGVLRNMLNGRTPTKKFQSSNGHSRLDYGSTVNKIVPGNVLFSSQDTYSMDELKQKLLDSAQEEDYEYAYIVRKMKGNGVIALYRIYVEDGREELLRGARLPDFTMRSFKRVTGAAEGEFFYNTSSSGHINTFIVPEALLFEELEVVRNSELVLKTPFIVPGPEYNDSDK